MIFIAATSYFHKNSFHYFEDYLMTKLTLPKGKVCINTNVACAFGLKWNLLSNLKWC
jgi:hypothetical protein